MRTVRDESGKRYVLVEESGPTSLVRDPATGEETRLDSDRLEPAPERPSLRTAARAVPDPVRRTVTAVPDEAALGVLVELADRGPLAARELLGGDDLCESDLYGRLGELRAAGLVAEATVAGEQGYRATAAAREAVASLRGE